MRKASLYITLIIGFLPGLLSAQSNLKKNIADIKYKYLELAEFPDYLKKSEFLTELDPEDKKRYIVGEIIGYYKEKKLCIIKEFSKKEKARYSREFYLYEGKLIFVYEQLQQPDTFTNDQGETKRKMKTTYSCSYYFKDNKLIHKKPKGSSDLYPASMSHAAIRELMSRLVDEYTNKLKAAKAPPEK